MSQQHRQSLLCLEPWWSTTLSVITTLIYSSIAQVPKMWLHQTNVRRQKSFVAHSCAYLGLIKECSWRSIMFNSTYGNGIRKIATELAVALGSPVNSYTRDF